MQWGSESRTAAVEHRGLACTMLSMESRSMQAPSSVIYLCPCRVRTRNISQSGWVQTYRQHHCPTGRRRAREKRETDRESEGSSRKNSARHKPIATRLLGSWAGHGVACTSVLPRLAWLSLVHDFHMCPLWRLRTRELTGSRNGPASPVSADRGCLFRSRANFGLSLTSSVTTVHTSSQKAAAVSTVAWCGLS